MSMGKVAKTRTLQQNAKKEKILVPALTALTGGWRTGGRDKAAMSGFRRVQPTRGHSFSCCLSIPRSHCSEPPLEEGRHPHAVMGYQAGKAEPLRTFGGTPSDTRVHTQSSTCPQVTMN